MIDLNDPTALALLASSSLAEAGIEHALYGGLLLASFGEPRETRDADLAVNVPGSVAMREALSARGLVAVTTFEDVRFGGLLLSRVTVFGGGAVGLNTVDLVRPASDRYAREVQVRAINVTLREQAIRVVTPEDFVLLKLLSTRERDLDDAASVLRRGGARLDLNQVVHGAGTLAIENPGHPVLARLAAVRQRA
jgi:hypothetical protein